MAFGQPSGPPASAKQVRELAALLQEAGHSDFRDARGPMGFTQRQAAGKFTRDEAEALIDRLQNQVPDEPVPVAAVRPFRQSGPEMVLRGLSDDQLTAEVTRRGWSVTKP